MSTVKTLKNRRSIRDNKFSLKELPTFRSLELEGNNLVFTLTDNRIIKIPVSWISGLKDASKEQLLKCSINGHFIFWDDLNEVIGVKNLLDGSVVPNQKKISH
jgi:hypothetical protein